MDYHAPINQAVHALRFCLCHVRKSRQWTAVPRSRKDRKLPEILSRLEVRSILPALQNPKHRALLALTYSAGLRVSEVARLRWHDLDCGRRTLTIRAGKDRKDRVTLLSRTALEILREYELLAQPDRTYLFPGQIGDSHISIRSAEKIFERAALRAQIDKAVSIHSLRHAFATHLLESGVDLRIIQTLLGHANSKTTEIYTHVSSSLLPRIVNPLDRMDD